MGTGQPEDPLIMRKLFYMGLESYEARYTLQLTEWNRRVFERRGLDVVYVPGETIDNTQSISVGQVLDAHGRSYFAMSQMMNLVQMMRNGEVTSEDVIYFEDMFQPVLKAFLISWIKSLLTFALKSLFVVLLKPLTLMTLCMYGAWRAGCRLMSGWSTRSRD